MRIHKFLPALFCIFCIGSSVNIVAQQYSSQKIIPIKEGEKWFGGAVNEAHLMPFKDGYTLNLFADTRGNQAVPLLLSTKGRFVWSEEPFQFSFKNNKLVIDYNQNALVVDSAGKNLKDAFSNASHQFFPSKNKLPDTLLFSQPQYNTWIELVYNQNQKDVLQYAHAIISHGFPAGVLMIDDNWANYYGNFNFRKDRFPDAAAMMDSLHAMGFKVMLWVCPFISPDTEIFRDLLAKKLLLLNKGKGADTTWDKAENPAIIQWWNGNSAVMDFTNPAAKKWYHTQLDNMVSTYHLDGFKFDAGDAEYYASNTVSFASATPNEHSRLWGELGLYYPLNEYRAMWKMGGEPLVQRLRDKQHNWEDILKLIPGLTIAGLLGYQFTCPDMIGGGEYGSFIGKKKLDEDLLVRSAQCAALMPMMQFSVAPWRVLDKEHFEAVKKAVVVRQKYSAYIVALAKEAAYTGEPIARSLEYQFPNQGFSDVQGQFMLGTKIMVAPMIVKGDRKFIHFPKGTWKSDEGKIIKGPSTLEQVVAINRLPVFELIKP